MKMNKNTKKKKTHRIAFRMKKEQKKMRVIFYRLSKQQRKIGAFYNRRWYGKRKKLVACLFFVCVVVFKTVESECEME